jgi:MFS family permease
MRISQTSAFALQASIILSFLAGSSAPTPLYAAYQAAWGFSPITVTIVFGIYAVAVLAALLVVGSLSDHVGRRPVLIVAAIVQAISMVIFVTASGVSGLIVARIVQGLATGAAAGAVGAGLLDIDRARGAVANAVVPMLGTATGSLVSGLMVQYLPWPTELVYLVLGAVFIAQAIGVALMAETAQRRPGALASLRPRFALPSQVRGALVFAAPALIAAWALAGFYASLGPSIVRSLAHSRSFALGGATLFVLGGSGALASYLLRNRAARTVMLTGTTALAGGVALTLLAFSRGSVPLFFFGAVVAGAGFGGAFQGAIRAVVPLAAPTERAGVLSILYVLAYLAMGVPAVFGGLGVVHGGGLIATANEYGIAVIALAAFALIGTAMRAPRLEADRTQPVLEAARS